MTDHVLDRPIRAIAAALRDGTTTAEALIDEVIARHQRLDGRLNAYKHFDGARARIEASGTDRLRAAAHDAGPLMGLPVSVKDLYGVRGMPTFGGTPAELPEKWRAEGPVVQALRRALGVIVGKSHSVEFAFGGVGTNRHWGTPWNPWDGDEHRAPGGSSSGAGVSLCMGTAVVAMGTDTGGSVRIPASVTGNVGLKVTAGRWSLDGIVPLSSSFDTPGPLTRSVEDAVIAFGVIDPAHGDAEALAARLDGLEASDLTLGVCDEHFWDECDPGIEEGARAAIAELEAAGAKIKRLSFPEATEARTHAWRAALFSVEGISFIEEGYPDRFETIDPDIGARFDLGRGIKASDYVSELRALQAMGRRVSERLRHVDAVVTPTLPVTPPTIEAVSDPETHATYRERMPRNTQPVNQLGLCAITMPAALDRTGMPVGLQLIGQPREEERLLAAALACEKVLGTGRARLGLPPLCA